MLYGCTTTSQPQATTKIEYISEPQPVPPEVYLVECPEELDTVDITKESWDSLSAEGQLNLIDKSKARWALEYQKCKLTHNELVRWHRTNDK